MTLTTKDEWVKITECATKIHFLEQTLNDLKEELKALRNEKVEAQREVNNKRLAIYLTIASILGGIVVIVFEKLIESIV